MNTQNKNFPKYFLVDNVPVKVYIEDGDLLGANSQNRPYPPMKAIAEGEEITEKQFKEEAQKLAPKKK